MNDGHMLLCYIQLSQLQCLGYCVFPNNFAYGTLIVEGSFFLRNVLQNNYYCCHMHKASSYSICMCVCGGV